MDSVRELQELTFVLGKQWRESQGRNLPRVYAAGLIFMFSQSSEGRPLQSSLRVVDVHTSRWDELSELPRRDLCAEALCRTLTWLERLLSWSLGGRNFFSCLFLKCEWAVFGARLIVMSGGPARARELYLAW